VIISPVGPSSAAPAASGAGNLANLATRASSDQMSVKFSPSLGASTPLEQVGSTVMDKLKNFEESRMSRNAAMRHMDAGPASAVESAKAGLLDGPASASMRSSNASPSVSQSTQADHAMEAMTRTFDYAIETQLIVKTGSQLSTSASSLMRGQ